MPKPLLETMTWPEARRAAEKGGRVVLLPVEAIEQHGPHLPVDVDNRIVTWLCDEAARRCPELIVSVPPIHYGFNEHNRPGGTRLPGHHHCEHGAVPELCH
jgi:creatinine amidohydrolase